MRAWRVRNRERVRAKGRERLRRLNASDPQRLAWIRERVRAWAKAHPQAIRASQAAPGWSDIATKCARVPGVSTSHTASSPL